MSTRFEHRATFSAPAGTVYSALVDRAFLEERLRLLGGKDAALVEHRGSGDEVSLRMRQGIDAERLPGAVRAILKGDLVVDRAEQWRPDGATGRVTISGVPGEIKSRTRLADLSGGGSELVTTAEVRVGIPLVGGKLEGVIAERVGKLLAAESEFTGKWLAEHP
ncbi:MAG TPA: DUF2505 domain-containing protein [Actinophytocola sp.]|uniref:DUF2505 domain-containing protein n=1 Tax=Actinophytocola sp. TaxID=1872138 RepID=UPI002DDD1C7F|nr:DUF2505 domain-containing protein [Actinophytocola sp.]HEV2779198.1 DUF2505 domain-containing protein [Actinophytocola sp.]